ncbi:MAG: histidine phosphatase family protein [Gemmataceae bacterium]|nr:histidine phosphatase family protein [Gemmataceae bacterium]MDW8244304.1 histidine phosphatase family protein [Thermogemmata sp.]
MTTRVWLVRHAETATPHLLHGAESDVPLGEHGWRQAAAAAEWFATQTPDVVVSSGMRRAVETAQVIARRCRIPHEIEPQWHERRVGPFSQQCGPAVEQAWQQTMQAWQNGDLNYAWPGMESFASIRERVLPVWQGVVHRHAGKRIVAVIHGVVCKVLLLSLLPGYSAADWTRIGKAYNLAVSELIGQGNHWQALRLLEVPEPVRLIDAQRTAAQRTSA